jgi:hypothetical protein
MVDVLAGITIDDFKSYFARDFSYGTTPGTIWDTDITKALTESRLSIRRSTILGKLLVIAFYYLTAHILVMNYRMSFAGVQDIGQQMVIGNNVTGISEDYVIPDKYKNNGVINYYAKSGYGLKYLSYILPNLIGNVGVISGMPGNVNQGISPYGFI